MIIFLPSAGHFLTTQPAKLRHNRAGHDFTNHSSAIHSILDQLLHTLDNVRLQIPARLGCIDHDLFTCTSRSDPSGSSSKQFKKQLKTNGLFVDREMLKPAM